MQVYAVCRNAPSHCVRKKHYMSLHRLTHPFKGCV